MKNKVSQSGEDPTIFENCYNAFKDTNWNTLLPCYAERILMRYDRSISGYNISDIWDTFNDEKSSEDLKNMTIGPCWLFNFNWGVDYNYYGEWVIWVVSIEDFTVRY